MAHGWAHCDTRKRDARERRGALVGGPERQHLGRDRTRGVCGREADADGREGTRGRGEEGRGIREPSLGCARGERRERKSMKSASDSAGEGAVLRAYGDREGDGMVQMSFTLRILPGDRAREAAKRFAEAHGLKDPLVTAMEKASLEHTYFVVYGRSVHSVDVSKIHVEELGAAPLGRDEIEARGKTLGRKIVVVGASTGSDPPTAGTAAILTSKRFHGA